MKKLNFILFLSLLLLPFMTTAQINNYTVAKKEARVPYDSLRNVPEIEIKSLIGQTIFFPEDAYIKSKGGYKKIFYSTPTFASTFTYGKEKEVYMPIIGDKTITSYDAITNRYFRIINITEKDNLGDFCFELEEVNEKEEPINIIIISDPIYMTYLWTSYDKPRFLTVGYLKKQSQNFLNKEYVWTARNYITNMENGAEECPPAGTVFKCIDVALINGRLGAVLENPEYGKFIGDLSQIKGKIFCFQENKDYKEWIRKYGRTIAKKMLEGDIYVGMSKKMVLASWGQPEDINSIAIGGTTQEQWVYPRTNRYLYFTGNKLTAIQDM